MSYQIIKQPNNLFSLFDTCTHTIYKRNLSKREVISFFVERAAEITRLEVMDLLEKLERGNKPYFQFTLTFEEAERIDAETRNFEEVAR